MPMIMPMRSALLLSAAVGAAVAAAVALAACEPSAVEAPSYVNDIRPILEANCSRCHGFPSANSAPTGFRLDVFDEYNTTDDGRTIRGAASMAGYIAIRTGDGTMPPTFPLDDWQVETLGNWYEIAVAENERHPVPLQGDRGDHPAGITATLVQEEDEMVITYEVIDPDGDTVTGSLFAFPVLGGGGGGLGGYCRITDELHAGRNVIHWNTRICPGGDYILRAYLHDGDNQERGDDPPIDIETFTLAQPENNAPPTPVILRPNRTLDEVVADANDPIEIALQVKNLEATDVLTATIKAVSVDCPGGPPCQELPIVTDRPVIDIEPAGSVGFCNPEQMYLACRTLRVPWQILKTAAGRWKIVATVSDGVNSPREASSLTVLVNHDGTDEVYGEPGNCDSATPSIACILDRSCAGPCHNGKDNNMHSRRPGVPRLDFRNYEAPNPSEYPGINQARGLAYRRVCLDGTMPPGSAESFATPDIHADPDIGGYTTLSLNDYGRLCAWLRGGAPLN